MTTTMRTGTIRSATMRTAMFLAVAALWASDAPLRGEEPEGEDAPYRYYFVDAALFSFQPGQELSSYRSLGRGGAGGNSECGYGAGRFTVSVKCNSKAHRFLAKVEVKPGAGETRIQAQEHEYDLSDLRLRTLDIARDDDGRIYRLNLAPRIDETPKPSPFRVKDLRLENWSFPASPVVLNDQDYIGQLSMSSGALAWCDIPGVAKIEFSLLHLKDAQPWGQLKDGIIEITHKDGTSLRITNVLNGVHRQVLDGGPYQVWVRWMEPTQTVGQYRQSVKKMIAEISERAKSGDLSLPPGTLRRLERQRESDRIQQTSNGLRGVRPDEIVGPE